MGFITIGIVGFLLVSKQDSGLNSNSLNPINKSSNSVIVSPSIPTQSLTTPGTGTNEKQTTNENDRLGSPHRVNVVPEGPIKIAH